MLQQPSPLVLCGGDHGGKGEVTLDKATPWPLHGLAWIAISSPQTLETQMQDYMSGSAVASPHR